MPDWAVTIVVAFLSTLSGAGGVVAYLRWRSDTRAARESRQDDHILKLISAQDASEVQFRDAVIKAYEYEVAARRELDARLTETQKQLTIAVAERDLFQRQLERAQADLTAAHAKIRHLEDEIAQLQAHNNQKEHA